MLLDHDLAYLSFIALLAAKGDDRDLSPEDLDALHDSIYDTLIGVVVKHGEREVGAATAQTSIALELMAPAA